MKHTNMNLVKAKTQSFTFAAPFANNVQLVGDFTHWQQQPINLQRGPDGVWEVVVKLERGAHHYRYLVDGQWCDDPECLLHTPNPFGGHDAVRLVA